MTSSGAYNFSETVLQIIQQSYRKLGVIMEDETPTPGMVSDAVLSFNGMLKGWATSSVS